MVLSKKVFELVRKVPYGSVTTYLEIAKALGNPGLARHVGNVLNGNQDPERIPCFKVVRSDGLVGGYVLGAAEKISRLEKSGVRIKNRRVVNLELFLHRFQKLPIFYKGDG